MLERSLRRGRIIRLNSLEMGEIPRFGRGIDGLGNSSFGTGMQRGMNLLTFSLRLSVRMILDHLEELWKFNSVIELTCYISFSNPVSIMSCSKMR